MAIFGKLFSPKADRLRTEKQKKDKKEAEKKKAIPDIVQESQKDSSLSATQTKIFIPGVLLAPHLTEKTSRGTEVGKYAFIIARDKNKIEAKKSIEKIYGVNVKSVKILNMPSKEKRLGKIIGRVPGFKKAVVTLEKGQSIEIQ